MSIQYLSQNGKILPQCNRGVGGKGSSFRGEVVRDFREEMVRVFVVIKASYTSKSLIALKIMLIRQRSNQPIKKVWSIIVPSTQRDKLVGNWV